MSEAPCNLLKLDATGLHFYLSKMRWKTLRHLLFPYTSRNDNDNIQDFVLWGFLKGPKMGRKVPKWAESLLVPCWASPN